MAVSALCIPLLVAACGPERADSPGHPPRRASAEARRSAGFAGRAACAECHPRQARAWSGSHHDRAMQAASPDTVLGRFDGATLEVDGVVWRFLRRDGRFFVRAPGPDGRPADFEVRFTFGVSPLQQVLVALDRGRLQALPAAWDVRGGRWLSLAEEGEPPAPGAPFHWTGLYRRWNLMCAECHSTGVEKGYDAAADAYRTTWAAIDVSCEACHGPGARHAASARSAARDTAPDTAPEPPPVAYRRPRDEVEACARCHARRHRVAAEDAPSAPLLDAFVPELLREGLYFADGQIQDEVYVYGSFLQSRMHARGVRCSDCHEPHSLALRTDGNALCTRCHGPDPDPRFPALRPAAYDSREHHFHPEGSEGSRCVRCHMPARTYMRVDARRDHAFLVPRPDLSVSIGTPDPCTGCHGDRSAQWAADAVARWYGADRPPHFGEVLAAGRSGAPGSAARLAGLASDPGAPAIVRATALELLPPGATPTQDALAAATRDGSALVRATAAAAFGRLSPDVQRELGPPLLDDSVRAVRLAAARSLSLLPRRDFPDAVRSRLDAALREYRAGQLAQADLPTARLNLGVLRASRGDLEGAERWYRGAIELDPGFVPARVNLAHIHDARGREEAALRELREAARLAPEDGEIAYQLALLLAQGGRIGDALPYLRRAARRLPDRARVRYNLGLALQHQGRLDDAAARLREAHRLDPDDADVLYALAVLHLQRGRLDASQRRLRELAELAPDDPRLDALERRLDAARRTGDRDGRARARPREP